MNESSETAKAEVPAPSDDKVPCVVCKEPIIRGAKVCNQCDRAQDWTRYLTRWGAIAAAAVAVLSLLSTADSLRGLIEDPANLRVMPRDCQLQSLELAVTNLGDRPAMLRRVSLKLKLDDVLDDEEMRLTASNGEEIIAPHDTHRVIYKRQVHGADAPLLSPAVGVKTCTYVVSIESADFEGNERTLSAECSCPDA